MKKVIFLMSIFCAFPVWADFDLSQTQNKITLQLQSEQWITSKTALVNVGINAAVAEQGIEKVQTEVMQKLNTLSNKGEWHVLTFNRQLNNTGLESIQIEAQARLPQSELSDLRNKAKAISKPGVTFTVDNIQFTPSDSEIRQANIDLRNNIYQQAKTEVDTLNKLYPEQKYYLHQIDFTYTPPVEPMAMTSNGVMMAKLSSKPLAVGNKTILQATIVIASFPDVILQKINH